MISDNSRTEQFALSRGVPFQQHLQLLNLSHDSIWARDLHNRITFWNRSAEKLLGWTAGQALGQTVHSLLRPQLPKPLAEIMAELLTVGFWEGEVACTAADGRLLVFDSRWVLQRDEQAAPVAVLEFNHDQTGDKDAEQALRAARAESERHVQAQLTELDEANLAFVESQDRFRQIADNIRDVVWLADPTMTSIIYVNPAYEQIWGRPCEELYQNPRSWFDRVHPDDRARLRHFFDRSLPAAEYEHTYRVVHPDGTVRWLLERGFPVRDNAGRFYRLVGIVRDITQHRALEKEILAISEREQQRLGQDLHDDLCQQLVGIEFLSKALEQQLAGRSGAAQAGEIAQLIRAAIGHTRVLARGLAPFGLESDGLAKALGALAVRVSESFRIGCAFHCSGVEIDDLTVTTNLYRIAQEAVSNSIKHGKATQIDLTLAGTDIGVRLAIADNGVGLPAQEKTPTGMGLRIMQYRADMMAATFAVRLQGHGGVIVECIVPRGRLETAT